MLRFLESSGDLGTLGRGSSPKDGVQGRLSRHEVAYRNAFLRQKEGGKPFQVKGINTNGETRNEGTTDLLFSSVTGTEVAQEGSGCILLWTQQKWD